jgi:YjjI family glycine radical enzyme
MVNILNIICSDTLTHEQKVMALANSAINMIEPFDLNGYKEKGIICDLNEGSVPLRPRYILPNYALLFEKGCEFLRLSPPSDLDEALNTLLIFYRHVPSVTNFPVYLGNLDELLESFVVKEIYEQAKKKLDLFLTAIDRMMPDAFVHANIGPKESVTGNIILELEAKNQNAVPNLTLKYDADITPDEFAKKAILTQLSVSKPAFANHKMFVKEFGENYAIASCYNGLLIGGGGFTLVRLLLGKLAQDAKNETHFFDEILPKALNTMADFMDKRVEFLCTKTNFFESNFLAKEGFIQREKFLAMFGIVGLAECVNTLIKSGRYGHSDEADALGCRIMDYIAEFTKNRNNFVLHGQVGIDSDKDQSPGSRIPIGDEPGELSGHLMHCAKVHKYFPSGVGDIFPVESTVMKNPDFVLDMIKGAFAMNVRYLTFHDSNADVVRITGYLAKRSEMEKIKKNEPVLHFTTHFGLTAINNVGINNRKTR